MKMELTNNRTKIRLIIASGVYLLLFICGIVFVGIRKTTNLPPIYVINIGVDLFGMLTTRDTVYFYIISATIRQALVTEGVKPATAAKSRSSGSPSRAVRNRFFSVSVLIRP